MLRQPDHRETLDLAEWVDEVADRFEAAWKSLTPPAMESFVGDATGEARAALLAELEKIERAYRRKVATLPTPSTEPGASGLRQDLPAARPDLPGYEIVAELGRGGMGVVYKARQQGLPRLVAIKMLPTGTVAAGRQHRFKAEAEAVARLQHPNIVQIYEVGNCCGQPFFVLEYVAGGSLAQRLSGQPLPARLAATLVQTLAQAVHFAHQHQIVHRDLKPANILLQIADCRLQIDNCPGTLARGVSEGPSNPQSAIFNLQSAIPKISDFGLAKELDAADATFQTRTGEIVGTPSYMAPEQASGKAKEVGAAADIYALGAILYELMTGRPPFRGESTLDTLEQVRRQDPVLPRRLQPKLPRDLETICLKCLAKVPSRRYAGAQELADDLGRFLEGKPICARPVSQAEKLWRWCRRNPTVASLTAGVALLLIVMAAGSTIAALRLKTGRDDLAKSQQEVKNNLERTEESLALMQTAKGATLLDQGDMLGLLDVLEGRRKVEKWPELREAYNHLWSGWHAACAGKLVQVFGHDGDGVDTLAFSEDGRLLMTASQRGTARVWDVATGRCKVFPRNAGDSSVALTPDGRHLLTRTHSGVQAFDTESGNALGRISEPCDWLRLGTKGKWVALGIKGNIRLCDVPSLKSSKVLSPLEGNGSLERFAISQDGRYVASGAVQSGQRTSFLHDLKMGTRRELVPAPIGYLYTLAFSPDGKLLATGHHQGDKAARLWNTATGAPVGEPLAHDEDVHDLTFSPDSKLLATVSFDGTARLWNCTTGKLHIPPLRHNGPVVTVAFHPDGRWLATGSYDNMARVWDVAAGQVVGWPLPHRGIVKAVAFSPDGKQLATASLDGTARLWDLTRATPRMFPHKHRVWGVAFAPDGKYWASCSEDGFTSLRHLNKGGISEQWLSQPLDTGRGQVVALAFASDSRHLLTGGDVSLQAWSVPGGRPSGEPRLAPAFAVAISPDGQWLASGHHGDGTGPNLWRWDARSGRKIGPRPHVVTGLAFHPVNANLLAVAGSGNEVYLWDILGEKVNGEPLPHGARAEALAFSPDGRLLATAARDGMIRFWTSETPSPTRKRGFASEGSQDWQSVHLTGTPIHTPAFANALAFSPDGRLLASASADATVRLWEVTTRLPCGPALKHGGFATSVAFSPPTTDGRWLATGSFDKYARLWPLPPVTENPQEMEERTKLALGMKLNKHGLVETIPWREWQELRQAVTAKNLK